MAVTMELAKCKLDSVVVEEFGLNKLDTELAVDFNFSLEKGNDSYIRDRICGSPE
jgi:hypothetical protein